MDSQNQSLSNQLMVLDSDALDSFYTVTSGSTELLNMCHEFTQTMDIILEAKRQGPDTINFPQSKEPWMKIQNVLDKTLSQCQSQYEIIHRSMSHFQLAYKLTNKVNEQLLSLPNPIEYAQCYVEDSEAIIETSQNALKALNQLQIQLNENWDEQIEQISFSVGSEQARAIHRRLIQIQKEIQRIQTEINKEIARTDIIDNQMSLAQCKGTIKQHEVLKANVQYEIEQNQKNQQHNENINSQIENALTKSSNDLVTTLNNINSQSQQNLQRISDNFEQRKNQINQEKIQKDKEINDQKEPLIHKIQNPQLITWTTQHSKRTGIFGWGKKTWTETHHKFEDTTEFKQKLETLKELEIAYDENVQKELSQHLSDMQREKMAAQREQQAMSNVAKSTESEMKNTLNKESQRIKNQIISCQNKHEDFKKKQAAHELSIKEGLEKERVLQNLIEKLQKEQKNTLERLKYDLESSLMELEKTKQMKNNLLQTLGYHDLETLFDSLKTIENVLFQINNRKMILSNKVGFVNYFDKIVQSTFRSIINCASEYKLFKDTIKQKLVRDLVELNEQNTGQNELQKIMQVLNKYEKARNELSGNEYFYLNTLADTDPNDDIWEDAGIEKMVFRRLLIKAVVDRKREVMTLAIQNKYNNRLKAEYGQIEKLMNNLLTYQDKDNSVKEKIQNQTNVSYQIDQLD